jgi:hypothetical protein
MSYNDRVLRQSPLIRGILRKLQEAPTAQTIDLTPINAALSEKAALVHSHQISEVENLQPNLDGKAAAVHQHVISDTTGLQTALDGKQATLVSGTNIKTINGTPILGSGDLVISGGGGGVTGTGVAQQVAFFNAASGIAGTSDFTYDSINKRLKIGGGSLFASQQYCLDIKSVGNNLALAVNGEVNIANGAYVDPFSGVAYDLKMGGSGNAIATRGKVAFDNGTINTTGSGSLLINTNTNAGFRLDVNGTGRIQGELTVTGALKNRIPANRQTSAYTLVLADEGKLVETNVASANNLTVPANSSVAFPIGTQIVLAQYGAGQTTIVASAGVTLRSSGNKLKLSAQYAMATLVKIGTDEWYVSGDLSL